MSIVRQLIQIAMVEASRRRTIAGDMVFDSKVNVFEGLREGEARALLVFSVEEAESERDGQEAEGLLGRDAKLTVLAQAAIMSGRVIVADDGSTVIVPAVGENDAAYEARLNLLDRQWKQVLHDHDNAWSRIFRGLIVKIGTIRDARSVDPESGERQSLRVTQFGVDVMPDPLPGEDLPDAIEAGLAAMEADGDQGYANIASTWRQVLGETGDWPDWRVLQSALFTTRDGMAALGQGPVVIDDLVNLDTGVIEMSGIGAVTIEADDVDSP